MNKQLQKSGLPHVLVPIRLDGPKESIEKVRWLHEKFGFTFSGTIKEVGMKFGKYLDISNYYLVV